MAKTQQNMDFIRVDKAVFEACPDESIDYAVMDQQAKTEQVVAAPLDAGWNYVGSCSALWEIANIDEHMGQSGITGVNVGTDFDILYSRSSDSGATRTTAVAIAVMPMLIASQIFFHV